MKLFSCLGSKRCSKIDTKKDSKWVQKGTPKEHQNLIERVQKEVPKSVKESVSHPELKKCDFERQYESLATSSITEKASFWDPFGALLGATGVKKGDPKKRLLK